MASPRLRRVAMRWKITWLMEPSERVWGADVGSLAVSALHARCVSCPGNTKGRCLIRRLSDTLLTVMGFLACPCHLIITLLLLISRLPGTILGSFLKQNTGLVYTGAGIYFVVALALGASFLFGPKRQSTQGKTACPTCTLRDTHTSDPRQSSWSKDLPGTRRYH